MTLSRRNTLKLLAASVGAGASPLPPYAGKPQSVRHPAGQFPAVGTDVDLAAFGRERIWEGAPGIEWDEPRDVWRVELEFAESGTAPSGRDWSIDYWVRSWPAVPSGGWTKIDTPSQGQWRRIQTEREEAHGDRLALHFAPLSEAENPNAKNAPGYAPSFRRTLKVRLRSNSNPVSVKRFSIYSGSRWNTRELAIYTGCDRNNPFEPKVAAYNGIVFEPAPITGTPAGVRVRVMYTEHGPASNDRTILTIRGGPYAFGMSVDDVIERKCVFLRTLGVLICDATGSESFESFRQRADIREGEDIISRTSRHAEQSLTNALGEIPRLALTARAGSHPFRYIPLGFTGSREKYGLDFNGNVFISKRGAKAMREDLARMLWPGDQLYCRIGTGAVPDFREREFAARQSLLEDYLPLVTTTWSNSGIDYEERAYATMLNAPLDDSQLRGDEPSVLLLSLSACNAASKPGEACVWFLVSPEETLELRNGMLLATGNKEHSYSSPRLRAAFEMTSTRPEFHDVPARSAHQGRALRWRTALSPGETRTLTIKIPFRNMRAPEQLRQMSSIHFDSRLDETLGYWRRATGRGIEIDVPDEAFNSFFRAALQHVLVSQERDTKTGYTMCPCGTYDYNIFANETDIQVRLLDMRGLHDVAGRCLQPLIELQGSEAFPGLFSDTSAELHGARVDSEHDYTMGGYNLDHGWTLWTVADHYFYQRDQDWLRKVMPHMSKAANWIVQQRKVTKRLGPGGARVAEFGLLPPGDLEDNNDWEHWFAVNGYACRGLARAAEAISDIDPAEGARLKGEAEAYRQDIRTAAFQAMAISPAVPLRDGTFVPMIPPRSSLHGRDLGWIRNVLYGAHTLIDCGVFSPREPVATWILHDYEDNLFMAADSLSVPDHDWFSRGGVALQPNLVNTFVSYLARDQLPQAIRALYNDFAISYYPDVNCFTEWVPRLGTGGGPFFKTSDESAFLIWLRLMLVREDGDHLYLGSGAPKSWFSPGRTIRIEHAASFFGELGFRVEAHPEQGFIEARVSLPQRNRPAEIQLRLRHPADKKIARVELDGKPWDRFDAQRGLVSIPAQAAETTVRAYY